MIQGNRWFLFSETTHQVNGAVQSRKKAASSRTQWIAAESAKSQIRASMATQTFVSAGASPRKDAEPVKFQGCAEYAPWPGDRARKIIEMVRNLETVQDMRVLTELCAG